MAGRWARADSLAPRTKPAKPPGAQDVTKWQPIVKANREVPTLKFAARRRARAATRPRTARAASSAAVSGGSGKP